MTDISEEYPGVEQAYDFVLPSYGWMLSRLEAADTRIQAIQAFAVSVTFGVPAAVKALSLNVSFTAPKLYVAIGCFGLLMVVGVIGQMRGAVKLANPALFYQKWLHLKQWEFKKDAVYFAGQHFEINGAAIRRKANASLGMVVLFLVELLFLFAWLVTP